jgi:hypothetical protein
MDDHVSVGHNVCVCHVPVLWVNGKRRRFNVYVLKVAGVTSISKYTSRLKRARKARRCKPPHTHTNKHSVNLHFSFSPMPVLY